jgi:SAM-dependent methyltransferase
VRYDTIGRGYSACRRADPRIEAAVHAALGDARTVVNVGAGTGSCEPTDRPVIPVEPSTAMALQRDPALPPAVLGVAETPPLAADTADAAMAVMTMHHWTDVDRGLAEMVRVARRRIVLLTIDAEVAATTWLFRDYMPEVAERDQREFPRVPYLLATLKGQVRVLTVPIPADCTDGFGLALRNRPEMILNPAVQAATSGFARMDPARLAAAVDRLARDLGNGSWDRRHGHLRKLPEFDIGLRPQLGFQRGLTSRVVARSPALCSNAPAVATIVTGQPHRGRPASRPAMGICGPLPAISLLGLGVDLDGLWGAPRRWCGKST